MSLSSGDKLGPYEIRSLLGAGGMGEVYLARDTRLDRTVAIKILTPSETQKSDANKRLDREARTISSLNHPNICQLYDVGQQDGISYIVMEYLEGETLAQRLSKGALTLEQTLKCGIEICEALEKAHRSGVIHRDLKPGNIMLTRTGAKLLDFGLAKPVAPLNPDVTKTQSSQAPEFLLTEEGTVMGTPQFMSPEQVEGKELDRRSDIFSLGAVLYEMVTGKRAFEGKTQLSVASAILEKEPPPIKSLKPAMPNALQHVIDRCLAKNPEERWQAVYDVGLELKWIVSDLNASTGVVPGSRAPRKSRELWAWVVAAVFAVTCMVVLAIGFVHRAPQSEVSVRSSLLAPRGASFLPYNFAISPDGSRLAFVALGPDGKTALWIRVLSSHNAQQLTDTEDAIFPFWSPDSLNVGFFAQGRLKTVDLASSAVQIICDAPAAFGGTWNQDGVIVFAPGITGPLYRVRAAGGNPEAVTSAPDKSSQSSHWPYFLPDGKHFIYTVNWAGNQRNGLYIASLENRAPKLISAELSGNVLFASGDLLYVRDRTIMAQPFDTKRLQTSGPAVPITQQEVDKFFDFWQSGFTVSHNGKVVFQSAADAPSRLVWYDPSGKELGEFPEIGYQGPEFSLDGRSLAVYSDDEHNGKHFIRVYDLQRGISTRLTEGGDESNPVWSHDSKYIAFRDASLNIEVVPVDGSGPSRPLVNGTNVIPNSWSVDGHLIYMNLEGGVYPSLDIYSSVGPKSMQFERFGAEANFSPDGKWIVYIALPMHQIFVQPFPGPGSHIQVSSMTGSSQPRWSHDGKKIFYVQPDRKLMVVSFDAATNSVSPPQLFAQTRIVVTAFGWFQYDVAADGRLLVDSLPASNASPLTLVTGWDTLVPRR